MNLKEIRSLFIKRNGRFDLVVDTTDYVDNGANFFIQAGQRILDSILPTRKSTGVYVVDTVTNQSSILLKYIRFIDKIEVNKSGISRNEVYRKPYSWLREQYGDDWGQQAVGTITISAIPTTGGWIIGSETYTIGVNFVAGSTVSDTIDNAVTAINANSSLVTAQKYSSSKILITYNTIGTAGNSVAFSTTMNNTTMNGSGYLGGTIAGRANNITAGQPLYYAPILTTPHPSLTVDNIGSLDTKDILFGVDKFQKDGILFMPPADDSYTLTIYADFFSKLEDDLDTSYHSEMYPDLLILAANLSIEMFYRNRSGMEDWLSAMKIILDGIDKDMVYAEMLNAGNQLRG